MRPLTIRTTRGASLPALGLALASLLSWAPPTAALPGFLGRTSGAALTSLPAPSLALIVAAADEKQRTPKPKDEPPRYKPGSDDSKQSDDDSGSDCATNCASNIFDSMFIHPEPAHSAPAQPLAPALPPAPRAWTVDDHGWLHAKVPGDSVVLFQGPVEAGRTDVEAGRLPDGTEVVVVETHELSSGVELRVRPADGLEPVGWVPVATVGTAPIPAPSPGATPAPSAPSPPPTHEVGPRPKWALQVAAGAGGFGKRELADEYERSDNVLSHLDAHVLGFGRKDWLMWGAGVGYSEAAGQPQYDYATAALVDVPHHSGWRLLTLDLLVGQRWRDRKGGRLSWSFGPAIFHLRETADIRTFTHDSTQTLVGVREERLERWVGGATARVGAGWQVTRWLEVGLQVDGFLMAWDGRREKSVSSDFIRGPLDALDVCLALTYTRP